MTDVHKGIIIRTQVISDITPAEAAAIFAGWDAEQQALFFNQVMIEAEDWPGGAWHSQAMHIESEMTEKAKSMIRDLHDWMGDA